jgi:hypothetical protein
MHIVRLCCATLKLEKNQSVLRSNTYLLVPVRNLTALPYASIPTIPYANRPQHHQKATWQVQYAGEPDLTIDANVSNLDRFDTPEPLIPTLHRRGVFVMFYISAGTYEDCNPMLSGFLLLCWEKPWKTGRANGGWIFVAWDILDPIIETRLDLAA